jgi:hypothetical protein
VEHLCWGGLSLRPRHFGLILWLWWRCCWLDAELQLLGYRRGLGALDLRRWWRESEWEGGFGWRSVVGLHLDGDTD